MASNECFAESFNFCCSKPCWIWWSGFLFNKIAAHCNVRTLDAWHDNRVLLRIIIIDMKRQLIRVKKISGQNVEGYNFCFCASYCHVTENPSYIRADYTMWTRFTRATTTATTKVRVPFKTCRFFVVPSLA